MPCPHLARHHVRRLWMVCQNPSCIACILREAHVEIVWIQRTQHRPHPWRFFWCILRPWTRCKMRNILLHVRLVHHHPMRYKRRSIWGFEQRCACEILVRVIIPWSVETCKELKSVLQNPQNQTSNVDDCLSTVFTGIVKGIEISEQDHIQIPHKVVVAEIWNVLHRSQFKKLLQIPS